MSDSEPPVAEALGAHRQVPVRRGTNATVPLMSSSNPAGLPPPTEHSSLEPSAIGHSYGTLPGRRRIFSKASLARRNFSQMSIVNSLQRARSNSLMNVPSLSYSTFSDLSFARFNTRPISTYDEPLHTKSGEVPDADAKINGIRVWYTSFTSIDWLHDAIKNSARFSKLRKRKSVRSRIRLSFDRSLGWIIVTVVGFLTALVAFIVVRSEQWLFDLKEGYCVPSWWKAKRFCCSQLADKDLMGSGVKHPLADLCPAWRTWSAMLLSDPNSEDNVMEYVSYTCIAVTS